MTSKWTEILSHPVELLTNFYVKYSKETKFSSIVVDVQRDSDIEHSQVM